MYKRVLLEYIIHPLQHPAPCDTEGTAYFHKYKRMMGMEPLCLYNVDNLSRFWFQHVPCSGHVSSDSVYSCFGPNGQQQKKATEKKNIKIMIGLMSWVLTHRVDGGGPVSVLWLAD